MNNQHHILLNILTHLIFEGGGVEAIEVTIVPKKKVDIKSLGSYQRVSDDDIKEECGICLENYKEKEYKRVLPKCQHVFHKRCCDRWFKSQSEMTCPVCRETYSS